jgi:hypothetical protein
MEDVPRAWPCVTQQALVSPRHPALGQFRISAAVLSAEIEMRRLPPRHTQLGPVALAR